ncbi:MAG: hypothetical protein IKT40_05915 [Bacilli bacterium]|nr:hypothetical protein [Bacilli bacterium]
MTDKTKNFIEKARNIHGNKYDYSKVEYINNSTKVCIICPIHGEFYQTPIKHINRKQNCPKCSNINKSLKLRLSTEEFIRRAKEVHGSKYDYSKVEYINSKTKITIICLIHGEFEIVPYAHLEGNGCNKCGILKTNLKNSDTLSEFIEKSKQIHGDRYDYSNVEYINNKTHVKLICNKCGFEFSVKPNNHLTNKSGCPNCNKSKLENDIEKLLIKNNIEFIYQYKPLFDENKKLTLDFYIPSLNIGIECQGIQHFECGWFNNFNKEEFDKLIKRDELKFQLCNKNNIKLIYYSNIKKYKNDYISKLYNNILDIKKIILK